LAALDLPGPRGEAPERSNGAVSSGDGTARLWRYFRYAADLVAFVMPLLTRGLTVRQRRDNHLPPLPGEPADLDAILLRSMHEGRRV
jgi:hypothetical protein